MEITTTIVGDIGKIYKNEVLPLVSRAELRNLLREVAEETKQELTDILNRAPLGTVSDPGDPPKTKSGNFVRSIMIQQNGDSFRVFPTVSYAARLELMLNRPWSEPTASNIESRLSSITRKILDERRK